jgi:SAM-dependent methyltransferase
MIGSRLYNRIFWGTSPEAYRKFARTAVASADSGWLLDAGCGTLLLTAEAYCAAPARPVVAIDQSLGMLRAARHRLRAIAGEMPSHIVLMQADLLDLPFAADRFSSIVSMGMLHLFDSLDPVLESLRRVLQPNASAFFSSLVENGRFGDRYLRFLHRAGEVAAPRTPSELETALSKSFDIASNYVDGNMAFVQAR